MTEPDEREPEACGDCGCRPEWCGRDPFAPGSRVVVAEVPGGYVVWPATEDDG